MELFMGAYQQPDACHGRIYLNPISEIFQKLLLFSFHEIHRTIQ